jgi:hypothetical protein
MSWRLLASRIRIRFRLLEGDTFLWIYRGWLNMVAPFL